MQRTAFLAVLVAVPTLQAGVISYFDGVLADFDWSTLVIRQDAGIVSTSNGQIAAGGNPGEYRSYSFTAGNLLGGTSTTGVLASFHNSFAYDPSTSGTILSLVIEYDLTKIAGNGVAGVYRPVIRQNGSIFGLTLSQQDAAGPGAGWASFSHTTTAASDWFPFVGFGSGLPDFSETGSPIELGFRPFLTISCGLTPPASCTGGSTFSSGIDNFRVTVTFADPVAPVPEPSLMILNVAGLVAAAFFSRRRLAR